LLIRHALGVGDPATARHAEGCVACRAEVARFSDATGLLRGSVSLERRSETDGCLDELTLADFVEGRLTPESRRPVVAHLLTCARCRAVAVATGRLLADPVLARELPPAGASLTERRRRRWFVPLGLAAAATLLVLLWPRSSDDGALPPGLREPADTGIVAPVPIAPLASVARVDRLVWSSVPRVERYRVRLYSEAGDVLWTTETTDTLIAAPRIPALAPGTPYLWMVEAQTEWQRWTASDLVEFRIVKGEGARQ
jgi:anti-sigma factor RsiW